MKKLFFLLSFVSLVSFVVLSALIHFGRLVTTDFTLMVKIQDAVPHRLDGALALIVDLASMEIMTGLLLLLLIIAPVKKRLKILTLVLYMGGFVLIFAGKLFLHHPAPAYMFHRDALGLGLPSTHVQVQYSYPSGHTYRSVFVMLCVPLAMQKLVRKSSVAMSTVGLLSVGFSGTVMASLVILGKHWVTDIFGGALLAVGLVTFLVGIGLIIHKQS